MQVQDLHIDRLHHAYLVSGNSADKITLEDSLESLFGIKLIGNPDVLIKRLDAFKVDDAREVVEYASKSALIVNAKKVILMYFTNITREAQNILLKTLEEPAKDTHIFIVTTNVDILLPTVLSRCMGVGLDRSENLGAELVDEAAKEFINANVSERLKIIDKIVKGKDKAENKTKILEILNGVERHLENNKPELTNDNELHKWKIGTEAVLQAQIYMRDKGAMSKMLMESVALVL